MKNYSNIYRMLITSSFLFIILIGCNPTSTANILFKGDGETFDKLNDNAMLFGRISDKETNEPLLGAYVSLVDSEYGTACDFYGNYMMKDILPGIYNIEVGFVGYKKLVLSDIKLEINRKYLIDFKLQQEEIDIWY